MAAPPGSSGAVISYCSSLCLEIVTVANEGLRTRGPKILEDQGWVRPRARFR